MLKYKYLSDLNLEDKFFDSLREDYPNFNNWFNTKLDERAICNFEGNNLKDLLFIKYELNDYPLDVVPALSKKAPKLKISIFKCTNSYISHIFMFIIFALGFESYEEDSTLEGKVKEIYITFHDNKDYTVKMERFLMKYGFKFHGYLGKEKVYIFNSK